MLDADVTMPFCLQFLVLVSLPVSPGEVQPLRKLLAANGGWIAAYIPDNAFVIVSRRSALPMIHELAGGSSEPELCKILSMYVRMMPQHTSYNAQNKFEIPAQQK